MFRKMQSDLDRFYSKVSPEPTSGCWLWLARHDKDGYAQMHMGSRSDSSRRTDHAYRVAYELLRGEIPPAMEIDHKCRNRACVNPDHLEVVTQIINTMRGMAPSARNARKTQCKWGHAYDAKNTCTYRGVNGRAWRKCRLCAENRRKAG